MDKTRGEWTLLIEVSGAFQAELLRGLLEAQEIEVVLLQEGAGRAYGLGVGPLSEVQMYVSQEDLETARQLLDDYYRGSLEIDGGES